jgi:hypothetical protein
MDGVSHTPRVSISVVLRCEKMKKSVQTAIPFECCETCKHWSQEGPHYLGECRWFMGTDTNFPEWFAYFRITNRMTRRKGRLCACHEVERGY